MANSFSLKYRKTHLLLLFSITIGTLFIDQLTKFLAKTFLLKEVFVVPGVLSLNFFKNYGSTLGLPVPCFLIIPLSLSTLLAIILYFKNGNKLESSQLALGLILGGAIGNIIDRISLGYVIDFIDIKFFSIFNVADIAIVIGIILLGFKILRSDKIEAKCE
ncbi:signal peptidase II [bacterium (Candidatus Torokbacteria) CG_4_10_14_0_2_um_filter_35_8]|nr:MAG: signal peptidase II [bacterium (Candidatus Torokbacteria) CG_4_10_14_0_2_um_filter_35_8]